MKSEKLSVILLTAILLSLNGSISAADSREKHDSGDQYFSDFLMDTGPAGGRKNDSEKTDNKGVSISGNVSGTEGKENFRQDITDPLFQPGKGKLFSDTALVKSSYRMNGNNARFLTFILQEDISYGLTEQIAITGGLQRVGSKMKNIHVAGHDHYSYKNIYDIGLKFRLVPVEKFTLGIQGHYKNVQSERSAGEDTDGIAGSARLSYEHRIADPFIEISYVRDFKESDDVAKTGIMAGLFRNFGRYTGIFNLYRSHLTGSSHLISYGAGVSGHYRFTENMAAGIGTEVHLDSSHAGGAYSEIENAVTVKLLFRALF